MTCPTGAPVPGSSRRARFAPFQWLARGIVRHPWYPILFWILLLLVAMPAVFNVGSVTTNAATTLPSSAPSVVAQNALNRLFPNASAPGTTFVLLTGSNLTSAFGQRVVLAVAQSIQMNRTLRDVASVDTVYSAYRAYLTGQAELGLGFLAGAIHGRPSLPDAVNQSSELVWLPASVYVQNWVQIVQRLPPLAPPSDANWPAYNQSRQQLGSNATATAVLAAFYFGNGSVPGFNQTVTPTCLSSHNITPCADSTVRSVMAGFLPQLLPSPSARALPLLAAADLGVENFTSWSALQNLGSRFLGIEVGLPATWLLQLWRAFPNATPSAGAVDGWTHAVVTGSTIARYPLPVPAAISESFVTRSGNASLVIVTFSQSNSYAGPNGTTPVARDITEISALVPQVLRQLDPNGTVAFYQTGPTALDQNENAVLAADLQFILPITVSVLILITILYFRAPITPVLTFGAIGIALGLGLAAIYLLGRFVTLFDVTSLTLVDTFVLGVGTDYSVFLVARYHEELVKGANPHDAVVTTVTWAGESIATSGLTVIVSTLAMAFSGVGLLSQWGIALSVSVFLTLLLALTVTPALLVLLGPRIFWPYTKTRFQRRAEQRRKAIESGQTYFQRAGRAATRRPKTVLALVALASIPLVFVALQVPLSYNFYAQLPANQPASLGLAALGHRFGAGYTFPTLILVTFAQPLLVGNQTNATEFLEVADVTALMNATPGVASVDSPVGVGGAPLASWINFSALPAAPRINLGTALLGYVGTDQRTVAFTVTPQFDGLSNQAVASLNAIQNRLSGYASGHPAIRAVYYGGAASDIRDLNTQTNLATQRMAIAATIGLFAVLFLVLGSAAIPPMALATIGLSISWAYALVYLLLGVLQRLALFFFVPVILFVLVLGLGMDYNVFLLTRVREERLRGASSSEAVVSAVTHTGGVITAAAVILASAFLVLGTSDFTLLKAIGLAVGLAVVLDAMVVRTYLVPAALGVGKERIWWGPKRLRRTPPPSLAAADPAQPPPGRP